MVGTKISSSRCSSLTVQRAHGKQSQDTREENNWEIRHGIFPPIGGFPPIERSHGSFLRSVQIRWENYRVYLTCERFSESNFANLPHASISFLHGTFSNGVNLFCFGHHHSVHGLAESTTKGSNPLASQPFTDCRQIGGHFVCVSTMFPELANWWQPLWKTWPERLPTTWS